MEVELIFSKDNNDYSEIYFLLLCVRHCPLFLWVEEISQKNGLVASWSIYQRTILNKAVYRSIWYILLLLLSPF